VSIEDGIRNAVRAELRLALADLLPPLIQKAVRDAGVKEEMDCDEAALFMGKVNADGTPNAKAFRVFICRHPVPRHKVGSRLLFRRSELTQWLEEHPQEARRLTKGAG